MRTNCKKDLFMHQKLRGDWEKSLVAPGPTCLKITLQQNNLTSASHIFPKKCLCQQFCMKFRKKCTQTAQKTCFCTDNFGDTGKKVS